MNILEDNIEFALNPEPRCPCILLVDTSSSMSGEPIQALNQGLKDFKDSLMQDEVARERIEVSIISFDSEVRVIQDFVVASQFKPPALSAHGTTHMSAGILKALELIQIRKEAYRINGISYYRPWIFMITDGEPCGELETLTKEVSLRIKEQEEYRRISFFAVGLEGANLEILNKISTRPAVKLKDLQFKELFTWLSASINAVSVSRSDSASVELPPITGWAQVDI